MDIDKELIKKVAKVARLELKEDEIFKFENDFKDILEHFKVLDELDTSKVELSIQPIEIADVLREDIPGTCLTQEQALSNSHNHKKDGYFKGPKAV